MIIFPAIKKIESGGVVGLNPSAQYPVEWSNVIELIKKYGYVKAVFSKPDKPATEKQNKAFHALLAEFWKSGLSSYSTYDALRATMKTVFLTQCFKIVDVCGKESIDIKSWSTFTRAERKNSIDCLIKECLNAGFNSKEIDLLGGV